MAFLDAQERTAVAAAIRAAEARTSGEIVTVVARRADAYLWAPLAAAAVFSLLVPATAVPLAAAVSAGDLVFIQLVCFLALLLALLIPRVRDALIPASVKRAAARRLAHEQFFARGLHLTEGRTGVLIFVSLAERYVEILADEGIHRKVAPGAWQSIVDAFVARVRRGDVAPGFIAAIEQVGTVLATHFPAAAKNPDELPDRLFVI